MMTIRRSRKNRFPELLAALALILPLVAIAAGGPAPAEANAATDLNDLVTVDRVSVKTRWTAVEFPAPYAQAPIVVAGPASRVGAQAVTVRVRNVSPTGFEMRLSEWPYLDGNHTYETVSYLAMPAGVHVLASGAVIEAGTATVPADGTEIRFSGTFVEPPTLLSTVVPMSQPALAVRTEVDTSGFSVHVDAEEADSAPHGGTINWVAWSTGSEDGGTDSVAWESHPQSIKHKYVGLSFDRGYVRPCVLADMNTVNGRDTANLRYRDLTNRSIQVRISEERSADSETAHTFERVGTLVIDCTHNPPTMEPDFAFGDTLIGTPTLLTGWDYDERGGRVVRIGVAVRHRASGDWLQADGGFGPQVKRFDAEIVQQGDGTIWDPDRWSYEAELPDDNYALSLYTWDTDGNRVPLVPYRHFTVSAAPTAAGTILDATGDVGMFTSIELDSSGSPVIAYMGRTSDDPESREATVKVIHCTNSACTTFSGPFSVAPSELPDPESSQETAQLDLEIDSHGYPVIAFNGTIVHCVDTNCELPPSVQYKGPRGGISLEIDDTDHPVVSSGDWGLQVMHCTDANCENTPLFGPSLPPNDVLWTSLALDTDGNPVVAAWDWSSESSMDLTVTHCSDPYCQGPASFEEIAGGWSEVPWKTVSMTLDANGNPVIVIKQPNPDLSAISRPTVIHCSDPACAGPASMHEIADNINAGKASSLALSPTGLPIVAYDNWLKAIGQRDLMLAYCTDPACSGPPEATIVDNGAFADWISLVVDDAGTAFVSYYDTKAGDLRFARVAAP